MNKFWSVLFFATALILSWNVIHSESAIGSETHSGIQAELANIILQTVKAKRPGVEDIRITRMWTETLDEHKVRAVFAYAFEEKEEDGSSIRSIQGEAILHREPSDDSRVDRWVLQHVRATGDALDFQEGTVVTPVPGADEEAASEQQ